MELLSAKNVQVSSASQNLTVTILPGVSGSGLVTETEPNDTQLAAQSIAGQWSLNADANIGDATNTNTSTLIPHVTVTGTGDGSIDYFWFTVDAAGSKGIFDIDFASAGGVPLDSVITLYSSSGFVLATNDDSLMPMLDAGSSSFQDSFLEYTFTSPGTYLIAVQESGGTGVPLGAVYSLHASLEQSVVVAEGGTVTAIVTREGSTVGDLTVTLSVPVNGSRVTVPATVTIPDGAASAAFTIIAEDDLVATGLQTVIVAARAAGYTSVTDSLDITDDEIPALTVSILPGTVSESDGVGAAVATITRNTPTDRDLIVTIASLDPSEIAMSGAIYGSGLVADAEPNDTLATAQSLDGEWALNYDANVGDATNTNTSTSIPHIRVSGTGNGTMDYFSFTVGTVPSKGIFDIDFGTTGGYLDSYLTLYRADGTILASNDDAWLLPALDVGSSSYLDSFFEHTFTTAGTYFIGVRGLGYPGVPTGATYTLQVSLENAVAAGNVEELQVTIPAGSASVDVPLTAVQDFLVDGDQTANVAALAAGHAHGEQTIEVTDSGVRRMLSLNISARGGGRGEHQRDGHAER